MFQMSVEQALRNAVAAEQGAAAFYARLAERAADARTRRFFEAMRGVELQHGAEIEEFSRRVLEVELARAPSADIELAETAPTWDCVDHLSVDEGMQIALESETQASLYYDAMADRVREPASTYFRALAVAEAYHSRMVREAIDRRSARRPTLAQVVRNCVEAEKAAGRFYQRLAERAVHPAAKKFLHQMVEVERGHADEIQQLASRVLRAPVAASADIEVDTIETAPVWVTDDHLSVEAALRIAYEAELNAARCYERVAESLSGDEADFVRTIAESERAHAAMIVEVLRQTLPTSIG